MPYFDHNATSPLRDCARDEWLRVEGGLRANASALYPSARRAALELTRARSRAAALLGVEPERVIFTSGATEADNAVLRHFARKDAICAVSAAEHPAVFEAAKAFFGANMLVLPLEASGRVDLPRAHRVIADRRPAIVSVLSANSETGILQPVAQIADICREYGCAFHCDAVQSFGRVPLGDMPARCDFLSLGAHKLGGPGGVGILLAPAEGSGLHIQYGGAQEGKRRAGTENLACIVGAVAAMGEAVKELSSGLAARQAGYRDAFEARMLALGAKVLGCAAPRLPNTSMMLMPLAESHRWVLRLASLGFEIGVGSACASNAAEPSRMLTALGIGKSAAKRVIRVSSCARTGEDEWLALTDAVVETLRQMRTENETDEFGVILPG